MLNKHNNIKTNKRFLLHFVVLCLVLVIFLWTEMSYFNTNRQQAEKIYNHHYVQNSNLLLAQQYAYQMSYAMTMCLNSDIGSDVTKLQDELLVMNEMYEKVGDIFFNIEELFTAESSDKNLYYETFRHNYALVQKNIRDFEQNIHSQRKDKVNDIFLNNFLLNFENLTNAISRLVEISEKELSVSYSAMMETSNAQRQRSMMFFIVFAILLFASFGMLSSGIQHRLHRINLLLGQLLRGVLPEGAVDTHKDEIGTIHNQINKHINHLLQTASFAKNIGKGRLNIAYKPLSDEDTLGNALVEMQDNLLDSQIAAQKRKEEDGRQNWLNKGVALFNDIMRNSNDDIEEIGYNIIRNLADYLNVPVGGIYLYHDEGANGPYLQLAASYAYNSRKYIDVTIAIGEGLIGTCAEEKKTIYISEIPPNYIQIESGFGTTEPRYLLLVPLKLNERIFGIIEMAMLAELPKYMIDFVEIVGENISSTLNNAQINQRTNRLLEESQLQAEDMKAQEEEMRQNMEELLASQEEMKRKQEETEKLATKLQRNESRMKEALHKSTAAQKTLRRKEKILEEQLLKLSDMESRLKKLHTEDFDIKHIHLADLIDLGDLQVLQDTFAEATQIAVEILTPTGEPITHQSRPQLLCQQLIGCSAAGNADCKHTLKILMQASTTWSITPCKGAGLLEGIVPINVGGKMLAFWKIGHVIDSDSDVNRLPAYAEKIGVDIELYRIELAKVPRMPKKQFEKYARLLNYITKVYTNILSGNHSQLQDIE